MVPFESYHSQNVYKKNWTPRISMLTMIWICPWYDIIYILSQYFIWINFSMSLNMILFKSFSENVFPRTIDVQAPRRFSCNIKEIKLHEKPNIISVKCTEIVLLCTHDQKYRVSPFGFMSMAFFFRANWYPKTNTHCHNC